MIVKKFQAPTETEAVLKARDELGSSAVVLNVKTLKQRGIFRLFRKDMVEITAAQEENEGAGEKSRTSFDEIVALYQFDAELRELFLKYLLQIERHIGNLIAYHFVEAHGISQTEYMNPCNYNNTSRNKKIIAGLIRKLHGAITTTDYTHVNYYRTNIPAHLPGT